MVDWENKPVNIKDDYDEAKLYFEGLVQDFKTYTQNSGMGSGKMGYESANQMADVGDKIRKYIQEIASASVADKEKTAELAANISKESKAKDAQFQVMTAQIQALTNTVATLSTAIAAAAKTGDGGSSNGGGGGGGGGGGSGSGGSGGSGGGGSGGGGGGRGGERTFKFTRNMGAYCSMHGHHPVGANHTSATCTSKREGHNNLATADHRFGGSNFWPGQSKVKPSQQDHVSYKGKSANN
jgi:hypothetical protein